MKRAPAEEEREDSDSENDSSQRSSKPSISGFFKYGGLFHSLLSISPPRGRMLIPLRLETDLF